MSETESKSETKAEAETKAEDETKAEASTKKPSATTVRRRRQRQLVVGFEHDHETVHKINITMK